MWSNFYLVSHEKRIWFILYECKENEGEIQKHNTADLLKKNRDYMLHQQLDDFLVYVYF